MLKIVIRHKLSEKKLYGLCLALHQKENIFTPEIGEFHSYRLMAKNGVKALEPIDEIYKTLYLRLISNKSPRLIVFENPVNSLRSAHRSVEFPSQERFRKFLDALLNYWYSKKVCGENHFLTKVIDTMCKNKASSCRSFELKEINRPLIQKARIVSNPSGELCNCGP